MTDWKLITPRWREPGTPPALDLIHWIDLALCAVEGGDWFPDRGTRTDASIEKAICARCPVREACLAYALDRGEPWGIWGGLTEEERQALVFRHLGITPDTADQTDDVDDSEDDTEQHAPRAA